MNNQEFLDGIKNGTLPPVGILRRTGPAKKVRITTQTNGEVIDVPEITVDNPTKSPEPGM